MGKTRWHKRVSNSGPLALESYALPLCHTGWAKIIREWPEISKKYFFSDKLDAHTHKAAKLGVLRDAAKLQKAEGS